jgi:hypothetical protein
MLEEFSRAIELYDRIIERTRDSRIREEAQNNRDYLVGFRYG